MPVMFTTLMVREAQQRGGALLKPETCYSGKKKALPGMPRDSSEWVFTKIIGFPGFDQTASKHRWTQTVCGRVVYHIAILANWINGRARGHHCGNVADF